jgi:hypothetical protein
VGADDKMCLKPKYNHAIVSHAKYCCDLPDVVSSSDVGYSSLILVTSSLKQELTLDLLNGSDKDWASEFGKIKVKSLEYVKSTSTQNIQDLEIITNALHDLCIQEKDAAGDSVEASYLFKENAYTTQMEIVLEQMEFMHQKVICRRVDSDWRLCNTN